MGKLGIEERPKELALLRACASVGQCLLMNAWSEALESVGLIASQVLLTREDFKSRDRSIKVQETLASLLERGIVPIVNENDSVSDEEIKFGDNDVLSALLASLGTAELLVILSTAKGLMTHPDAGRLSRSWPKSLPPSSKWPKELKPDGRGWNDNQNNRSENSHQIRMRRLHRKRRKPSRAC